MKSKIFSTLLIIFGAVSFALATEVEECGGGVPTPIHVEVKGCDKPPCQFVQGTDVIMIMNFTAPVPLDAIEAKVIPIVMGVPIFIYTLPEPDACKGLINTHCPLEINEPGVYKLQMPIENYPEVALQLKFSLRANGGKANMVCFKIQGEVVIP